MKHLVAGVDELASETALSEGWTYSLFPPASIAAIDAAVSGLGVKAFHGKKFKKGQVSEYRVFLASARRQLELHDNALLMSTLLDTSWKKEFLALGRRLIAKSMAAAGVADRDAVALAEHLFPGLMTLQRLAANLPAAESVEIEIDSDSVSRHLGTSKVQVSGRSLSTARLLRVAYEAYRAKRFPSSPSLQAGGLRALRDARSRSIQIADTFGNFALSYVFALLGHASRTRAVKAQVFDDVFGDVLDPNEVIGSAKLVGKDDVEITKPGGLSLRIGMSVT
jgi:hypothetical protein